MNYYEKIMIVKMRIVFYYFMNYNHYQERNVYKERFAGRRIRDVEK